MTTTSTVQKSRVVYSTNGDGRYTAEVRCPRCDKKLAEEMRGGVLKIWCKRCKFYPVFDRRSEASVS